jgi:uncharacterized protein (TIGR02145 family)
MIKRNRGIVRSGTYIHILTILFICGGILSQIALIAQDVKIGTQVWMSKNLDISIYRNGDSIPQARNKEQWTYAAENELPAWCYHEFDEENAKIYGKIYNFFAISDPRKLAPIGYHVPSDMEWEVLVEFLGGENTAGKKLKSKSGWRKKGNGDNSSGFNGLPNGYCSLNADFMDIGQSGNWWSRTPTSNSYATAISIYYTHNKVLLENTAKFWGLAVRCLKD